MTYHDGTEATPETISRHKWVYVYYAWSSKTVSFEFIQILYNSQMHWICVTSINCPHGSVKVYDILYTTITPLAKEQIADLLHVKEANKIDILIQLIVDSMQQVYALVMTQASSSSIEEIFGNTYGNASWTEKLLPFISRKISIPGYPVKVEIRIYCSCYHRYNQHNNQPMAECTRCCK